MHKTVQTDRKCLNTTQTDKINDFDGSKKKMTFQFQDGLIASGSVMFVLKCPMLGNHVKIWETTACYYAKQIFKLCANSRSLISQFEQCIIVTWAYNL